MVDRVTVAISRDTAERLRRLGRYGDTMESIIHRVLDEYEKLEKEPRMVRSIITAIGVPCMAYVLRSTALAVIPF